MTDADHQTTVPERRPRRRAHRLVAVGGVVLLAAAGLYVGLGGSGPARRLALHVAPQGGAAAGCPASRPCTLAAALEQAHYSTATITLESGTYVIPTMVVDDDVTITGAGEGSTTLESEGENGPVVLVQPAYSATLADLTVTGGSWTDPTQTEAAGGIANAGTLTLDDVAVTDNQESGALDGAGGIVNTGTLTLDSALVEGNSASGSYSCAGGIANDGTLDVGTGSVVEYNDCVDTYVDGAGGVLDGGSQLASSRGNAGADPSSAMVSIDGATIACNATYTTAPLATPECSSWGSTYTTVPDSPCSGSNCTATGGLLNAGTADVTDSTFSGNAGADGGGLLDDSTATVSDSTFFDNSAASAEPSRYNYQEGSGGAILAGDELGYADLTVEDSTFSGNTAAAAGGAIQDWGSSVFVAASTFSGSTAGSGGVDVDNGEEGVAAVAGDLFADAGACADTEDVAYVAGVDDSCLASPSGPAGVSSAAVADLGPLADNGGPTETMEPESGNPAIGLIPNPTTASFTGAFSDSYQLCPATDQRGYVTNGPCDAGALQTTGTNGGGGGSVSVGQTTTTSTTAPAPTTTSTTTPASPTSTVPPVTTTTAPPAAGVPTHGGPAGVTPGGKGWWVVGSGGSVDTYGDAPNLGSEAGKRLKASIVAVAGTPDGHGYWLVGSDGGVFTFGDARFYGSLGDIHLAGPIVGIAPTPDGRGYWLVGSDGGVFTFGDAGFYGSLGSSRRLAGPIVGISATPNGHGYWLVGSDGGVFNFGDAGFFGSEGSSPPSHKVVALGPTSDGHGYWVVTSSGQVFRFGDAGSGPAPSAAGHPVVEIFSTSTGYVLIDSSGNAYRVKT